MKRSLYPKPYTLKHQQGQAMIIAILALGGAILGATAIAGLLLLYSIRATTDSENSAKAIFAADAGINWALYTYYHPPAGPLPIFTNGASTIVTCYDANSSTTTCDNASATASIARGTSLGSARAFLVQLNYATTTTP